MRFGSVCSGIEAASVAWGPLGWRAAWLAEIEPFPSAVLAHHYPDVPNLGDMKTLPERIVSGEIEAPNVFCGGTPCQAFSVAGLRKSLDDARGNLSLTFCEIANAIDTVRADRGDEPAIIFWENVPGVLSTKDNAFGCFLAGLAGEELPLLPPGGKWTNAGCVFGPQRAVAWRTLDAQYFGVAQRRRRVFVVASARDDFDPAAVLFEFDGVRRDTAPSREAGQAAAGGTGAGAQGRSGIVGSLACNTGPNGHDAGNFACNQAVDAGHVLPVITMAHGQGGAEIGFDRGPCLTCNHEAPIAAYGIRTANTSSNGWGIQEEATHTLDQAMGIAVAHALARANAEHAAVAIAFAENSRSEVRLEGGDGSRTGTLSTGGGKPGQGTPMVAVAMVNMQGSKGNAVAQADGPSFTLNAMHGHDMHAVAVPVAFHPTQDPISSTDGTTHGLGCGSSAGQASIAVATAMQVRRLTPVECERLQGFPDGYTNIPWRKKPESPDGPRYKALGNSWAVPVVRWIGKRIQEQTNAP